MAKKKKVNQILLALGISGLMLSIIYSFYGFQMKEQSRHEIWVTETGDYRLIETDEGYLLQGGNYMAGSNGLYSYSDLYLFNLEDESGEGSFVDFSQGFVVKNFYNYNQSSRDRSDYAELVEAMTSTVVTSQKNKQEWSLSFDFKEAYQAAESVNNDWEYYLMDFRDIKEIDELSLELIPFNSWEGGL